MDKRDGTASDKQPEEDDFFRRRHRGLPVDLNTLRLSQRQPQKQKPEEHSTSSRNINFKKPATFYPHESKKDGKKDDFRSKNTYASKLGFSKSCELPTLASSKTRARGQKARRTVSAPETLKLEITQSDRFTFERTNLQDYSLHETNGSRECNQSPVGPFKLPAIRITSAGEFKSNNIRKQPTDSDLNLPALKQKIK